MRFIIKNKEIELTAEEVAEIVKQSKETKQSLYFVPKMGEVYFVLNAACFYSSIWKNDNIDNGFLARAEIYRTKEEAQKADEKRLALGRIRKYIHENGLEFVPNWKNENEDKYQIIGWDYDDDMPDKGWYCYIDRSCHNLIFRSEEDRQKVLDNCKDDLRILLKNY
jgi:hypothetical protein